MPSVRAIRTPSVRPVAARRRSSVKPRFPVRVRRLYDRELIESAYDRHAVALVPDEIVDLADGTRLCEWGCGRLRYASEDDMWRDLHVRALGRMSGDLVSIGVYDARPAGFVLQKKKTARPGAAPLPTDPPAWSARDAYSERTSALLALRETGVGQLPRPRVVDAADAADDRPLDVLGRKARPRRAGRSSGTLLP